MENDYYTNGEKEFLLGIAKKTLDDFLFSKTKFEPQTVNKKLWEKHGVFITLNKKGKLRGCMGSVEAVESLILAVRDNVLSAANDSRFVPIERDELDDIKIEISILSEIKKVGIDDIKTGDGVLLKNGNNSATYLPQVWGDLNDKSSFLNSLCEKAGLDKSSLNNPETEFWIYSSISFSK